MTLRNQQVSRLAREEFDVLIIGGGINGAVSAAALAARGVRVGLIDARDFAGFTSQHSSNLVWGGIKYMEGYEFGLVAGLCKSRNELLDSFPSTVREIRFLMTLNRQFRFHPWVIFASTWLYWLLGRGRTRIPHLLSLKKIRKAEPRIDVDAAIAGVEYSDAFLHDNDARFVFNFVRSAMDKGCVAANYVAAESAGRDAGGDWVTQAVDQVSGERIEIRSKVMINATGAYVDSLNDACGITTEYCHLLSKGIHLIVPRISDADRVLAFFADDERLFFAIPMANRTCIGTTDTHVDDPETAVTEADREFVLSNINARLDLSKPLTRDDVISERCGVRPLAIKRSAAIATDVKQLSRKHIVETSAAERHVSIFGGKLTDCLNVGEEICDEVQRLGIALGPAERWYGEPDQARRDAFFRRVRALGLDVSIAADTSETLGSRLWRRYAENAHAMLDAIERDPDQAEPIIDEAGIRRCELSYLAEHEMIVTLDDYLRRRSKLALLMPHEELRHSEGLKEVCRNLFGDDAEARIDEYFNQA